MDWIHPASAASSDHIVLASATAQNTTATNASDLREVRRQLVELDDQIVITEFRPDLDSQQKAALIATYKRKIVYYERVEQCLVVGGKDCF